MNEVILVELRFFVISILWGCLIVIIYDCLRIIRNLIKHNKLTVALEDIVYWIICGFLIFQMMYKHNNGIIRTFSILGMLIGMLIYKYSFSEFLVKNISSILKKLTALLSILFSFLIKPFLGIKDVFNKTIGKIVREFFKKTKKRIQNSIKPLKNKVKSSKIPLNDFEDGDLFDEEKKKK